MVQVKLLTVNVSYSVGLSELEMPEIVYNQILEATKNGGEIDMDTMNDFPEAYAWISSEISERDSFDWSAEISELDLEK